MPAFFERILASVFWVYASALLTWLSVFMLALVFRKHLRKMLHYVTEQASVAETDLTRDRFISGGAAVCLFSLFVLMDVNLIFAILIAFTVYVLTPMLLRKRRFSLYQKAFDSSLVESLATVGSSLRAGLTLKDSLVVAAQNCPPVFSAEVARVLKDYRFGASIDAALDQVRKRVQTQNANIAFGALIIGTQLGGRIPEILARIVATIREVERVEGRLKALTAQGRAQGALLCSMPVIIGIGMYFFDHEKIDIMMTNPIGKVLLGMVVFLELIGIVTTLKVMQLDI